MKIHPQIISQKGAPAFVVIPYKEYERLMELLEDREDIEAIQSSAADSNGRLPLEVVEAIASGCNAIKTLREYRDMTQAELARKAKVSRQYISQVEAGEKKGSATFLKKVAGVLRVQLDLLV